MQEQPPSLDSLREKEGLAQSAKRKWATHLMKAGGIVAILLVLGGVFFSYRVLSAGRNVFEGDGDTGILASLGDLVGSDDRPLKGEEEGRTNILLLGIGGEGHSGNLLTDTMMLVSIEHPPHDSTGERHTPQVAMISLPRDMWVPVKSQGVEQKINSIYSYGEREDNDGIGRLSPVIEEVLGVPVHYYVRADFEGFTDVIDSLDGIEVEVEQGFIDREYPDNNFGYQTIQFDAGLQHMDGDTALKFSRSRHGVVTEGSGYEASDFARSRRQQLVLEAVREKALSTDTLLSPRKLTAIGEDLGDHVRTNMEPWEMLKFAEIAQDVQRDQIINKVLDNGANGLLYSTIHPDGGYSLLPNIPDFSEIKTFVNNIFFVRVIQEEQAPIAVLNGTFVTGLATSTSGQLEAEGYTVLHYGNAADQKTQQRTVIYAYSEDYPESVRTLLDRFDANLATVLPERSTLTRENDDVVPDDVGIVVVLGKDYAQDHQPIY